MDIRVDDYEKLGAFYLGREYNVGKRELQDELVMYDSKDLVTHGVVLGMTGSGKTGLCMALLEEAAMDNVPAIVIDPKGDIANLMLTFPNLQGEDFEPWVNEDDARKKGISKGEFADKTAAMWKKGLGEWGQSGERIQQMRDKVDINIFTPGSSAGIPVSILASLEAPPFEVLDDPELFGDKIESTVSSLLSLMGVDADPIQDPEHILLSNIFATAWRNEESLDLAKIIGYINRPPFEKVGVLDLESFFPEKKRFGLAMQMNNLLASPGFSAWLSGEPLDIQKMMYTPDGKPRVSIFSIAHLGDSERMFFVSLLLNQMLSWMRMQAGTTSLRAMLYMDEIYGYLPPSANPPSKKPMMTMLKQARAFGLGVLLATQNPVDLDYKALSNMGTWFLGRLQTERDKMRVLDGLEGAASSQDSTFDRGKMEQLLAGLGSRVFLMNNVHEDGPVTFHVRWVMSYLRGPLTRRQIKKVMDPKRAAFSGGSRQAALPSTSGSSSSSAAAPDPSNPLAPPRASTSRAKTKKSSAGGPRPVLKSSIKEFFMPITGGSGDGDLVYVPALIRAAAVNFDNNKLDIYEKRHITTVNLFQKGRQPVDWSNGKDIAERFDRLGYDPVKPSGFADLPAAGTQSTNYTALKKDFIDWIYRDVTLDLLKSPSLDQVSKPGEEESDFRIRLQHLARRARDEASDKLRDKYAVRMRRAENALQRAQDAVEVQEDQASAAKMQGAISIGTTILSSLFGRKSGGRARGVSSGARGMSRAMKERGDVRRAEEKLRRAQNEFADLQEQFEADLYEIRESIDPLTERLETEKLSPLKKNITVKSVGILWLPHYENEDGDREPAWN